MICKSRNLKARQAMPRWLALLALILLSAINTNSLAQERFDHFSTGFPLDGAHSTVTCQGCHTGGTFAATSPDCASCHGPNARIVASMKPPNHVATTQQCADCHTTSSWNAIPYMDHTAVMGSCGSCHNGINATGKTPTHIQSSDQCDDCHSSTAWEPARFDHTNVTGNCVSCHNGRDATGKSPMHILTTDVCEDCHSPVTWTPATRVDHTQVLGSCTSCHDGSSATPKTPDHFITMQECNDCHLTTAWVPHTYRHLALGYEPLDHRGNLACTDCHSANNAIINWRAPAYQPNCAGCHANDFEPGPHKKYENPDVRYTLGELQDCSGSCHIYNDSTETTIKENRPGPEHRISSGEF